MPILRTVFNPLFNDYGYNQWDGLIQLFLSIMFLLSLVTIVGNLVHRIPFIAATDRVQVLSPRMEDLATGNGGTLFSSAVVILALLGARVLRNCYAEA